MNDVLFSVAVITYNQEKYIAQTLDSILFQEHDYTYEIIVGEDCSSDGTRKVVEDYVRKYPDIIKPLYNDSNKGLIKNYFNVLEHCHGEFVMQCAGDDYWLPGKVKAQIEFMRTHPDVGLCYGNINVLHVDTGVFSPFKSKGYTTFEGLIQDPCIPAVSVCFKRNFLEKYCSDINPLNRSWLMEDYPMWLWFSLHSIIVFFPTVLAVYREFQESLSHTSDIDRNVRFLKSTVDVQNFFLQLQGKPSFIFDLNRELFVRYFSNMMQTGNFSLRKKCIQCGKEMKNILIKDRLKLFISRYLLLCRLYYKMKAIFIVE